MTLVIKVTHKEIKPMCKKIKESSGGIMIAYNHKVVFYPNGTVHLRKYKKPVIIQELSVEEKTDKHENKIEYMTEQIETLHELKQTFPFEIEDIDELQLADEFLSEEEIAERKRKSQYNSWRYTVNKINQYARCGFWEWFLTFTFGDDEIRYDYSECSKKIRKWLNHMKNRYAKDLQYLIVPEEHKDGAYHFHGLLANCCNMKFEKAVNPHNRTFIIQNGKQVYNLINYKFGFTTATKVDDTKKVTNYITKYITKEMCNNTFSRRRYFVSNNIPEPEIQLHFIDETDSQSAYEDLLEKYDLTYYNKSSVNEELFQQEVEYWDFSIKETVLNENDQD